MNDLYGDDMSPEESQDDGIDSGEYSLCKHLDEFVTRPSFKAESKPSYYPSEASVVVYEDGMRRVYGNCLRASYLRIKEGSVAQPKNIYLEWSAKHGSAIESMLITKFKEMGIWVADHVKFYNRDHNISGELDAVLIEPSTGKQYILECVTPKTLIPLSNGLLKEARHIKPGDLLLDLHGKSVRVKNVQIKNVKNVKIYRPRTRADGILSQFSDNHPLWVSDVRVSRYLKDHLRRSYWAKNERWIKARDLSKNQYVAHFVYPLVDKGVKEIDLLDYIGEDYFWDGHYFENRRNRRPALHAGKVPRFIKTNIDFFRFLGFFLAEGCASGATTTLSFHEDEIEYIDFCVNYLNRLFGPGRAGTRRHRDEHGNFTKCISVTICSTPFALFLRKLAGHLASNKRVPFLGQLSREQAEALVYKWLQGDGCLITSSRKLARPCRSGQKRGHTVSPHLAFGFYHVLCSLGFEPRLRKVAQGNTSFNDCGFIYRVEWSDLGWPKWNTEKGPIKNGLKFIKVRKVETRRFTGKLYNFEVTGSHTFTAGTIGTHNCKSFFGYLATKQIRGSKYQKGRPKENHLLQTALYLWHFRGRIDLARLFYFARDSGSHKEFKIWLKDGDNGQIKIVVDGIVEKEFTVNDIVDRFKLLDQYVKNEEVPPNDYELIYDKDRVEKERALGNVSDTAYKEWSKGRKQIGDWQCRSCEHRLKCWGQ